MGRVDIDGADRVAPALKKGLAEGLDDTGDWMLDEGEDKAKDIILGADRVWRKTLKQGFTAEKDQLTSRYYRWHGEIKNTAPHAEVNEDGLKPGSSPSVQDIIPWVDDNMTPDGDAQDAAASANLGNWTPELQKLAGWYSPGMVITAFAVKEGLEEDGYEGIDFMDTTEKYLGGQGRLHIKNKVEKHMNRELRKAGLK